MTPVDMHLLLLSLQTIKRVCTQERSNAQSNKKASHKSYKGMKQEATQERLHQETLGPVQETLGFIC